MIDFGGGMIFPSSYGRDEFSAREEAAQDAQAELDEALIDAFTAGVRFRETTNAPLPPDDDILAKLRRLPTEGKGAS